MRRDTEEPEAPDEFLRDPIESYLRPLLQDLAQQTPVPSALIRALSPRYTIAHQLGHGGMAGVYLAFDESLQRPVAVKVLEPAIADAVTSERFLREIELTAQLRHSRIVPVHDRGEGSGLLFYIMQHFPAGSLRERLDRSGPLSIPDTVAIATDVAQALDYAHAHGIVHRDIKPENILFDDEGAVVADFGVARLIAMTDRKKLTQTGIAIGTPFYMSPEQADTSAAIDGRSDVYALGCVVYEMLAGEPPFTGPDRRTILAKHLRPMSQSCATPSRRACNRRSRLPSARRPPIGTRRPVPSSTHSSTLRQVRHGRRVAHPPRPQPHRGL
jgi:serine/threonine-protein kinase